MKSALMCIKQAVLALALFAGVQAAFGHDVQIAYGTTPTGFVRIYLEHWHGPLSPSQLGPNDNINVSVTTASGTSTFNVNVSGTVNNTPVNSLPGLIGPITVLKTNGSSNEYNDWGYWDFAPGSCNQPISIQINGGNSVIFADSGGMYPATIAGQTFTDQAAPTITANNVTVNGDCTGAVVNYNVSVVDDCDPHPAVTYSKASGTFFPVGTTVVTVTATDNTGKTSVKAFNVTVISTDTTPPSLTVPQPIVANVEANACGAHVNFASLLSASDNCSTPTIATSRASGDLFPVGTTTVTATATDAAGNKTVKTFTVTVVDNIAPTLSVSDITVNAAPGTCAAPVSFQATATDNCSAVVTYSQASGSSFPVGTTVVTATATDPSGNTTTQTFNVIVVDNQAPTLATAASNVTVESDGAGNTAALSSWLSGNGGAAAVDNCSPVNWTNNFKGLTAGCGKTGSATVVFTASDATGNTVTTTATFTIVDTIAPTITTPATSVTVEADSTGNAAALSAWLASNGRATATDAGSSVTWSNSTTVVKGCGTTSTTTATFTATDACGNKSTTSATFTTVDTTAPAITTPAAGQTVEVDSSGNAAPLAAWLASNGGAVATDASSVTWSNTATTTKGCGSTSTTTATFTATDACGNKSTTTAAFTTVDTTAPAITTAAASATVEADGAGNTAALAAWLASNGGAVASDIGSAVAWSETHTTTKGCGSTSTTAATFTATDACGNKSSTSATFTITDTTAPTITTAAAGQTVETDGAGNTAALSAWLASNGGAAASDIGSAVTWSNSVTTTKGCGSTGTTKATFTATDACGNKSTTSATFTIVDTKAPVIGAAAANKTVEADGSGNTAALNAWLANNGGATASDVGSSVTWSNNFTALTKACGSTGSATVTFTASDACGNKSTTTATFTIVDTTKPTLTSNVYDIPPPDKPTTFTLSTTDIGGVSTPTVTNVYVYRINGAGKTIDLTKAVRYTISGGKLTILTTGGVGDVWVISGSAVDECGNTTTGQFVVHIINPGHN